MQVHDMSRIWIIFRWNFKWLLIAKLLKLVTFVWIFFPPWCLSYRCLQNKHQEHSRSPNVWQHWSLGNQLQFDKGNSVDAAPTSFSTTLVWLTSIWSAASLRKVENTSMLQLLPFKDAANWTLHHHFHAEFQRCVVSGWWPPTQSHSGLSWTYLLPHSVEAAITESCWVLLLQLTPSQILGLAVLHWLLVPPTRALKKHQKCWEWTICLCVIYIHT